MVVNEFSQLTSYLLTDRRVHCDSSIISSFVVNNCRAVMIDSWIRSSIPFTMEQKHQDVLKRMRQNIVADLDVNNGIIIPLTTEFILRDEDITEIKKGKTKPERAAILLDLLPL